MSSLPIQCLDGSPIVYKLNVLKYRKISSNLCFQATFPIFVGVAVVVTHFEPL